eukprot:TRINITY_DN3748_c0_g2_i1.p2 TRINITY_DN3748_c0_g2~~TRINITY_DN3748_c0_g2_i1.p2  ORF type:complete len:200 (-),score=43.76 TRINITY_DN3748_c0_g2_i1:1358-1927(-)
MNKPISKPKNKAAPLPALFCEIVGTKAEREIVVAEGSKFLKAKLLFGRVELHNATKSLFVANSDELAPHVKQVAKENFCLVNIESGVVVIKSFSKRGLAATLAVVEKKKSHVKYLKKLPAATASCLWQTQQQLLTEAAVGNNVQILWDDDQIGVKGTASDVAGMKGFVLKAAARVESQVVDIPAGLFQE